MYLEFRDDINISNLFADDFTYKTNIIKIHKDVANDIDFKTIKFTLHPDILLKYAVYIKNGNPIPNVSFVVDITLDILKTFIHRLYYYNPNYEVEISYYSDLGHILYQC